jgi:2-polyprenyl-3-methyl-5-hydroxy-6-metoxy-1,4-benzoquinol methylase
MLPLDEMRSKDFHLYGPPRTPREQLRRAGAMARALLEGWRARYAPGTRCPVCGSRGSALVPVALVDRPSLLHCTRCRVVFRLERPSTEELQRFYRRSTRDPLMRFSPQELENYLGHKHHCYNRLGLEAHEHRLGPERIALDVGCGAGQNLEALLRRGWRAEGIDPNPEQAERARQGGKSVEAADLEQAARDGARRGRYDLVTMFHVIEHLPDPAADLRALAELLRAGGLLVVETPLCCDLYNLDHLFFFTEGSLRLLVERAGFKVLSRFFYVAFQNAHDCLVILAQRERE